MTRPESSLTRADFDRIIARAMELDQHDRVDLAQARAIAEELGVSTEAWEAALRERDVETPAPTPAPRRSFFGRRCRGGGWSWRRIGWIAGAGFGLGVIGGAFGGGPGDAGVAFGVAAIAMGLSLVVDGHRRGDPRATHAALAGWWAALAMGIMVGLGKAHPDPIAFATVAWLGCATLAVVLDRSLERVAEAIAKR